MGFKHQAKVYKLVFDDPALEGLEVRCRSLSIGEVEDEDTKVFEQFAKALISWTLEGEDGQILPATLESVRAYPDYEFMALLANTWADAVSGVDAELGKDSPSGRRSLEESTLPMEPLSPSLAS